MAEQCQAAGRDTATLLRVPPRGTAMPWPDIVSLAPELAAAVGIAVLDAEA